MARAGSKKDAQTLVRAMARTQANALQAAKLAAATGTVIGARMAMGRAALTDPAVADPAEFMLMGSEKMSAAQASLTAALARTPAVATAITTYSMEEAATAWRAGVRMANSRTPAGLVQTQLNYVAGAMGRAVSFYMSLGAAGLAMTGAMTAPVLRTAAANARRLG